MKRQLSRIPIRGLAVIVLFGTLSAAAQTRVKPGFNIFSVEQDIEIGRQSSQEIEEQLPLLRNRSIRRYVNGLGKRLAEVAPGADYPYQLKVLNVSDINAFALPGGFIYINRGLIEAARSEGELAGVMAHEIGHVALRHGPIRSQRPTWPRLASDCWGPCSGSRSPLPKSSVQPAVLDSMRFL